MTARMAALGAVSLLAVTVGGCVSTDAEQALAPIDFPSTWAAYSEAASPDVMPITDDWLADMGDPDVVQIVSEALSYNNDLAASAARVRAARENARITLANQLPGINGSFSASSQTPAGGAQINQQTGQIVAGGSQDFYSVGFSFRWELDVWGRLTDQTRAAYKDARAQGLDFAASQLSIAGGAAQSWYALAEARLQRQLSERDVATGEANLRIIERRYERGLSSSLDLRLARSSLAQSRATLIQRQQAEQENARRLEVLMGRYPRAAIASADTLPELEVMVDEGGGLVGIGDPQSLLFRRPDIIAAESRLGAERLRVAAARKNFFPALSLSGSSQQNFDNVNDIEFDLDSLVSNILANLTQPVFQGGRLRAQAAAQRSQMEASAYTYASTVLSAYEEVENAVAAERFLTAQLDAQQLAFEEAVAAEELTNRQYVSGTTNIFNLINAQQRRISAESQYIAAARQRLSNRIDLYLALGAPFEAPLPDRTAGSDVPPPVRVPRNLPALKGDRS